MKSKGAIIRLVISYVLCVCLVVYAFSYIIIEKKPPFSDNFSKNGFSDNNFVFFEVKNTQNTNQNVVSTPVNTTQGTNSNLVTSSKPASTVAVKGNVIEKYISPYTAKLSYDKVYMKNSTPLSINIKNLLNSKLSYKIEKNNKPQVLIVHTHTTETYLSGDMKTYPNDYSSRTTNNGKNMVAIGEIIAKKLNNAGIKTLHDKTQHDYPQYNGSYGRSATTVKSYLSKYKDIKIVIDLHRDSITVSGNDKAKLVTKINGKKAAQVMLVMGSQSGSIKNHPNWQENLKLALKLQQTIEKKYPTLARPLSLVSKNYNQSLSKGALLIEFGTDMNSLDEAKYSAELVA